MLLALFATAALGADPDEKHYHNGLLAKYKIEPPSILLSASDEARLKTGKPVTMTLTGDGGAGRLIMVQDIKAPSQIILGCATDHSLRPPPFVASNAHSLRSPCRPSRKMTDTLVNAARRRIMDLEKYPKMVSGCNGCVNYASETKNGVTTVKSICTPRPMPLEPCLSRMERPLAMLSDIHVALRLP